MRHRRWLAAGAELVLAGVASVGLFASGNLLPVLGVISSLLGPLPCVFLGLRRGLPALVGSLGVATTTLAVALSPTEGALFLMEFGPAAILLAEGVRRNSRPEGVVSGVAALLTLGGLAGLVLGSGQWRDPLGAVGNHVEGLLVELEHFSRRIEQAGEAAGPLTGFAGRLRGFLPAAFPGLFFTGSLLMAGGHLVLLRGAIRRWPAQFGGLTPAAFRWELPELLVWAFIGSGLLSLGEIPWMKAVGLNGLVSLIGLYFLQGLSIALFLFQRFQPPRLLAVLVVLLLMSLPFVPLLVAGLGLFDVWFAFRSLSLPRPPRQT